MVAALIHKYELQRHAGFKSFSLCKYCGCTKHSRHYFFAGMKSKQEPPCNPSGKIDSAWLKTAVEVNYDEVN